MIETKTKIDIKQRTYIFALEVVKLLSKTDKTDYVLEVMGKQLLRCGTSIGANVSEAQGGSSRKDFINFYHHALKSSNETKFWLKLLNDSGKARELDKLINEADEISRILAASIISMKKR